MIGNEHLLTFGYKIRVDEFLEVESHVVASLGDKTFVFSEGYVWNSDKVEEFAADLLSLPEIQKNIKTKEDIDTISEELLAIKSWPPSILFQSNISDYFIKSTEDTPVIVSAPETAEAALQILLGEILMAVKLPKEDIETYILAESRMIKIS